MAGDEEATCSKVYQMITQRSLQGQLRKLRSQSGLQVFNLRPSSPKALNSSSAAQGYQAVTNFLFDFS